MPNGTGQITMIKVAFMGSYSSEWMGGVNYLSNLLYALSILDKKKIEPIVFTGTKTDPTILEKFRPYALVIQDELFDRKSIKWFLSQILEKLFKSFILKEKLLSKYNISVISHSDATAGFDKYKKINWIPDFQHRHLPDFFSENELIKRNNDFNKLLSLSDAVVVSSYDAYKDCKNFAPEFINKVNVLQFVSQPNKVETIFNADYKNHIEEKFQFTGKYFYLPNQFWKHKNHKVVFEAVRLLKERNIDVLILCSGHMQDYRHPDYVEDIKKYVKNHGLQKNIKFLGLIDYDEVLYLMRNSLAVINPSLFEGWSSTVEECKSMGKNMILSDIPIHREQNPINTVYFDANDSLELAQLLEQGFCSEISSNKKFEVLAKNLLFSRTVDFATKYQEIVLNIENSPKI